MEFKNQDVSEDEEKLEGEFDLKGELVSALDDLKSERKNVKKLKQELSKLKEQYENSKNIIINMKTQLEDVKKIE